MKNKKLLVVLVSLLLIVAIGIVLRFRIAECDTAAANKPETSDTKVLIEYFGDSTVVGSSPSKLDCQAATSAPRAMGQEYEKEFGSSVLVWNKGVSGSKASYFLTDGHEHWQDLMAKSHARIVIVNWGMNDAWFDPGVPVTTYKAELNSLADAAQASGKTLIFETPNPIAIDKKPYGDKTKSDRLASLVDAIRSVAIVRGIHVIDQYQYVQTLSEWQNLIGDGVHPKPELYRLKGQYAAKVLESLVKAELGKN